MLCAIIAESCVIEDVNAKQTNTDFEKVYQKEYPRLLGYVRKHFQSEYGWMDEEDLVQEVALNVFKKLDPARPIENMSAYLYSAITNKIKDLFRRKSTPQSPFEDFHSLFELANEEDVSSLYQHPEFVHAMAMAVKDLPDFERELIEKTSYEGYTYQQLAEEWSIPVGTLLSRKHRVLAKLQQELEPLRAQILKD